jgi:hypothetical protein
MKYLTHIPFIFFSLCAQAGDSALLNELASLVWKYRIIVVDEPQNEASTLALLNQHNAEINDRDIVWFILKEDIVLTSYPGTLAETFLSRTRETYGIGEDKVILIGKDGDIKSRLDRLDLKAIFRKIDAMPMRQYEMQH